MKKTLAIIIMVISINFSYSQWTQMPNGMGTTKTITSLAVIGNNVFAGITQGAGVYISSDNGANWIHTSLTLYGNKDVNYLYVSGNRLFAGADSCLWLSTDNGGTWARTSLMGHDILSLAVFGNDIFAGSSLVSASNGAFHSTNSGTTWTSCGLTGQSVYCFAKLNNNLFAGRSSDGVYLSTDNGSTWNHTSLNNRTVHSLAILGTSIFAGSDTGVFVSTNNGTSWSPTALSTSYIYSLTVSGGNLVAGASTGGLYVSTDCGVTWFPKNEGFSGSLSIFPASITANYIFVGTYVHSVWRRNITEVIGIKQISEIVPATYSLEQNYPNPFNPTTNIKFDIPVKSNVKIIVSDILGRTIGELVNESISSGIYETKWDGTNFASGIYFVKMITDTYSETKKIVLLK